MCAINGCCIGRPASSEVKIVSALTGARWKISSPRASDRAFKMVAQPPPTGGSPIPRAPTGVLRVTALSQQMHFIAGLNRLEVGFVVVAGHHQRDHVVGQ